MDWKIINLFSKHFSQERVWVSAAVWLAENKYELASEATNDTDEAVREAGLAVIILFNSIIYVI